VRPYDEPSLRPLQGFWGVLVVVVTLAATIYLQEFAYYTRVRGPYTFLIVVGGGVLLAGIGVWELIDAKRQQAHAADPAPLREEDWPTPEQRERQRRLKDIRRRLRAQLQRGVVWAKLVIGLGIALAVYGVAAKFWALMINRAY
jgi:hypothetical protein